MSLLNPTHPRRRGASTGVSGATTRGGRWIAGRRMTTPITTALQTRGSGAPQRAQPPPSLRNDEPDRFATT